MTGMTNMSRVDFYCTKNNSFTHPHVVTNLHDFLPSVEDKRRHCEDFSIQFRMRTEAFSFKNKVLLKTHELCYSPPEII